MNRVLLVIALASITVACGDSQADGGGAGSAGEDSGSPDAGTTDAPDAGPDAASAVDGDAGEPEDSEATCMDGKDNDGSGQIDCAQLSCAQLSVCASAPEGTLPGECFDGADNDGNGLIDCFDPACEARPVCEPVDIGSSCDPGNDDCAGDGICTADSVCEGAYERLYWVYVSSAIIPTQTASGDAWDALGGAPDPWVNVTLDGVPIGKTSAIADTFEPRWDAKFETAISGGDGTYPTLSLEFMDEDVSAHDIIDSCQVILWPDALRARYLGCLGDAVEVEVSIEPVP